MWKERKEVERCLMPPPSTPHQSDSSVALHPAGPDDVLSTTEVPVVSMGMPGSGLPASRATGLLLGLH